MNRKRKHYELYKGVFKNDKKSCLVDLKPKEEENTKECKENINNVNIIRPKKVIDLNLKVAKNLKFGVYFQKLREEKRLAAILIKKEFIQKKILLGQKVQYTYDYDGTSIISNKSEMELK